MFVAEKLANFVHGLRYEELPPDAVAAARRYLADSFACALAAYHAEPVAKARDYALARGGSPDATLIGAADKTPADVAALVNGTMVRYLDANDIFAPTPGREGGHFSDVIPALAALAEARGHDANELVTAVVANYELLGALSETYHFSRRGYHAITVEPWTLALVASRLLRAGPDAAVHACGLAGATGMVLNTWLRPSPSIPMIKAVAVGLASQRAVQSAELAALGVTASEDALETTFERLAPLHDAPANLGRVDELGERWTTTRNVIKSYPSQISTQAAVEAALALHRAGIRSESVAKLTVYGHNGVCGGVQGSPEAYAPATREAADHSTPFVVAMALLRGQLTAREYEGDPWDTADYKSLASRIELVREDARDEAMAQHGIMGVKLVAELTDGRAEEAVVHQPKGHPDAPMSDDELLAKMTWLLEDVAPADTPERIFELCHTMTTRDDLAALLAACRL